MGWIIKGIPLEGGCALTSGIWQSLTYEKIPDGRCLKINREGNASVLVLMTV